MAESSRGGGAEKERTEKWPKWRCLPKYAFALSMVLSLAAATAAEDFVAAEAMASAAIVVEVGREGRVAFPTSGGNHEDEIEEEMQTATSKFIVASPSSSSSAVAPTQVDVWRKRQQKLHEGRPSKIVLKGSVGQRFTKSKQIFWQRFDTCVNKSHIK
jgi:hypothetical protein